MSHHLRSIATSLILLTAGFLMAAPASAAGLTVDAGAPNGSDDTATLQAILDAGDIVSLRPGQTYCLSERLNITRSNSGIITTGTPAVLYLKNTFNNVEPLQTWDTARVDSIAIRAEGSHRGSAEKYSAGELQDRQAIPRRYVRDRRLVPGREKQQDRQPQRSRVSLSGRSSPSIRSTTSTSAAVTSTTRGRPTSTRTPGSPSSRGSSSTTTSSRAGGEAVGSTA